LVVVCAIALLFYSPLIAAISVAAVLSFALLRWAITGPLRRHTAEAIDQSTYQNILFYEAVRSIQTLKLYGQVAVRAAAWCARLSGELNAQTRIAILQLTQQSTGSLIGSLDRIAAICIGCLLVSRNELTAGGLFAILAFREQFSSKMFAMIERSVDFSLIGLHANRVGDILQAEPESENKDGYSVLPTETFSLQLERVSFSYAPMDPPVLRDLDIKVSQGETVAIVGPSGVGKTTVLKIMLGLFEPTGGQVIVNGRPLASINRTSYQSMIGTVMQDDTLLAGSIVDNVALFDERPDIELLKRCCDAAAIHETIQAMPMGYHSLVSEQGANLSGGQRQRLLLARALYRRPKLLLLDEATSHLDVDTERRVNEAISALGVTKVIVAHRPETIATADRQIRLQPASGGAFAQS
jgi:ATP-binding cassette subfamily B protein RaxB